MKNKLLFSFVFLALFFNYNVVAEESHGNAETGPAKVASSKPISLSMEAIQELEERKKSLDGRERELDERAKNLEVQEKILRDKLKKMEELTSKMALKLDGFKKDHDQRIGKLVTVVETMRPQSAAEYVENLDPNLAVEILARIQVGKAAKILNLVNKAKGAKLTELYTGFRQAQQDVAAPAPSEKEAPNNTGKM